MSYIQALKVIQDNEIRMPRDLAEKLWPDSDGWRRSHKVGRGSSPGAGMALAAGGLLGRLRQAGLVGVFYPVQITDKGRELLK